VALKKGNGVACVTIEARIRAGVASRRTFYVARALLVTALSLSCEPRRAAPVAGSVEGDAYLVMQSGDIKKAAGNPIFLIRDDAAFKAKYDSLCAALRSQYLRLRLADVQANAAYEKADSLWMSQLREGNAPPPEIKPLQAHADAYHALQQARADVVSSVRSALMGDTVASARTDMSAHYRFSAVNPGHYRLFGEKAIVDRQYQWWTTVEILPGQNLRKDLDNSAEANKSVYCGIL
jgi:hypothetical protein